MLDKEYKNEHKKWTVKLKSIWINTQIYSDRTQIAEWNKEDNVRHKRGIQ
jgi:hypothetical protein